MRKYLPHKTHFLFFVIGFVAISGCKTDEIVRLTKLLTENISNITDSSATVCASFTEIGDNLDNYGHCWSTHSGTTTSDNKSTLHGKAEGENFKSQITGLTGSTEYYVRAYAKDGNQIIY